MAESLVECGARARISGHAMKRMSERTRAASSKEASASQIATACANCRCATPKERYGFVIAISVLAENALRTRAKLMDRRAVASAREFPLSGGPVNKAFVEQVAQSFLEPRLRRTTDKRMDVCRRQIAITGHDAEDFEVSRCQRERLAGRASAHPGASSLHVQRSNIRPQRRYVHHVPPWSSMRSCVRL